MPVQGHRSVITLALGAGLVSLTASFASAQTMVIATDRQGSLMNRTGTAMAKVITDHSNMRAVVRPFAGPDAFVGALDRGEIKLAMLTGGSVHTEVHGLNKAGRVIKNIRILRSGPNVLRLGFMVPNDSDIKSVGDLKGRKITSNFGGHSAVTRSVEAGLASAGLGWDDVRQVPVTGVVDGIKALGAGRVEATWGAIGMPVVREINAQNAVRFLSFDNSAAAVARMRKVMFPGLKLVLIPRAIPPLSIRGPVNVITYDTYLLANKDLDDATATKVVEALWKGTDVLLKASPIFAGFKRENAVTTLPMAPYHPAAIAFYESQGLWTDRAMEANEMAAKDVR